MADRLAATAMRARLQFGDLSVALNDVAARLRTFLGGRLRNRNAAHTHRWNNPRTFRHERLPPGDTALSVK